MTRVIVADDDATTRKILLRMLTPHYQAVAVADGNQALSALLDQGAEIIITDLKMPAMDGLKLLERVKKVDPEVLVFVITGHASVDSAVEAMRQGAYDYLAKPFDPDEVLLRLQRALKERELEKRCASYQQERSIASRNMRLVTQHPAMLQVLELARKAARTDSTILVQGETGVGKEMLVRQIHQWSPRSQHPFIAVNCSALSEGIMESELFGHEKGAFTGASARRIGFFEMADQGTLLLDEIGTTDQRFQVKLLRVLQDQMIYRVGSPRAIKVDVRVIAATNQNLEEESQAGTFRSDLYYRLSVLTIQIPPLRERASDIPLLADHFIRKYQHINPGVQGVAQAGMALLDRYPFPGNVRELENIIERAMIIETGNLLTPDSLLLGSPAGTVAEKAPPPASSPPAATPLSMEEAEKEHILQVLAMCNGKKVQAASILGINKTTLWRKMKKYGIAEPS